MIQAAVECLQQLIAVYMFAGPVVEKVHELELSNPANGKPANDSKAVVGIVQV